jgi:hypothetical protein
MYHFMLSYFLILLISCSVGCGDQSQSNTTGEMMSTSLAQSGDTPNESELTQQLPLEFELSTTERNRYRSILSGIYTELTTEEGELIANEAADPTESCDRCGRETGFLPSPDLFINSFLRVEMKAFTFGLVSWSIDQESVTEALANFLGNEAPNIPEISYRLTVVRADLQSFDTIMAEQATSGTLLADQAPESVSITSVTTNAEEFGVNLDHGYSYLLFLHAVESISKLSSLSSEPVMIHCFESDEDQDNGGCIQLSSQSSL